MKKSILLLIMLTASISFLKAQTFTKGTNVLSALVGLGSSLGWYGSGTQTPALSVNFERGMWELGSSGVVSIGAYAGYKSFKYKGSGYKQSWNYTIIGVRSAYHYTGLNSDKLDVYGGLMLSYNILKYKYSDEGAGSFFSNGSYGSAAGLTAFIGGRYFFTQSIGVNAELGYGVAYLNLGLSFKLGGNAAK